MTIQWFTAVGSRHTSQAPSCVECRIEGYLSKQDCGSPHVLTYFHDRHCNPAPDLPTKLSRGPSPNTRARDLQQCHPKQASCPMPAQGAPFQDMKRALLQFVDGRCTCITDFKLSSILSIIHGTAMSLDLICSQLLRVDCGCGEAAASHFPLQTIADCLSCSLHMLRCSSQRLEASSGGSGPVEPASSILQTNPFPPLCKASTSLNPPSLRTCLHKHTVSWPAERGRLHASDRKEHRSSWRS